MRRRLSFLPLAALVLGLAFAVAPAGGAASPTADTPSARPHKIEGQDRRYLLGGTWLMRMDPADAGLAQRLYAQTSTDGWSATTVPSAWNAGDDSQPSFLGSIAWYRKDFRLPARAATLAWIARFESVNFRATVWLNGRKLGGHVGGYLPFELDLSNVSRKGVNHLVVRVDNRRTPADSNGTPGELPQPPGGWWNYGGLLREVSIRAVDRVDVEDVQVQPQLPCPRCSAAIALSATVRNLSRATQLVHLTGRFGGAPVDFGSQAIHAGASAAFAGRVVVGHPKLWSPAHPSLYAVRLRARAVRRPPPATRCARASARSRSTAPAG
jgi:beta-glucuronidase